MKIASCMPSSLIPRANKISTLITQQCCNHAPPPLTGVLALPPSIDTKTAKSKLKEYFDTRGLTDKGVVEYKTVPAVGKGFISTVTIPGVGCATGQQCRSKQEAEHSAAQKALNKFCQLASYIVARRMSLSATAARGIPQELVLNYYHFLMGRCLKVYQLHLEAHGQQLHV